MTTCQQRQVLLELAVSPTSADDRLRQSDNTLGHKEHAHIQKNTIDGPWHGFGETLHERRNEHRMNSAPKGATRPSFSCQLYWPTLRAANPC